jgi:hypothetical protein
MSEPNVRIGISKTAPYPSEVRVLLDTTYMSSGKTPVNGTPGGAKDWLTNNNIRRVTLSLLTDAASASAGLKAYRSLDGGVTWDQIPISGTLGGVTVAATTTYDLATWDFLVDHLGGDLKIVYTNGTSSPTVWLPSLVGIIGERHAGS